MVDRKAGSAHGKHVPINVHSEYEIVHWVSKLGVTREQLRNAIANVGPMADDIERYLSSQKSR